MGKIGDYNANIGIGNLYKVIEHGQEMGVVTQKDPECSGSGWKFDIPLSMKTPGIGSKIYDKAIRKFESDAKLDAGNIDPKVREKEVSDRLRRADETAKALCDDDKGGIEPFADELAGELHVKSSDKQKMAALRKITEQLFASKTVTWWGALKKEKQEELTKQEETKQAEMAKQEEYEKALRKADELDGPKKDEALKKLEDARKEDEAKKNLETLEKKAAADNLGEKIADLDRRLGRDFSKSDLMAAAVTLSHMVARGELDINHVETYLNETVFDYADQKATLQMTARAMGELRAKVIGEGWGDEYSRLVRIYAKSSEDRKGFLFCAYKNLVVAADKIREKRIELVRELGLASIPAQTGGSTGETLRRLTKQLEGRALAAFSNDAHCACDEVKEFKMKAEEFRSELAKLSFGLEGEELEDYLKKYERRAESLGDERVFTPEFQKDVATYLKVLSRGAELSARLEREEEIRKSFKKALGVIPRDENGLCRAGTYSVSFSLGASLSWGLDSGKPEFGAKDSKATLGAGASAGFTATVSIGEDGSASVSYGLNLSGDVTAGLEAPGVTVSGGGGLGGGWTKATAYKDIDSMCNDTSRMLLALTTGKEMKNLFHGGGVNSKSRDVAKRIDNYAMRSLMSEMKLMDDTDPYLTPMKYNPVTGIKDTFSGDLHGNARFSGGSDAKKAKNFIAKSGISGGASISLSGSISSAKNLKSHFAIARERGVLPKDDAKYGPGLVRYDYQHADEGLRGRAMPRETQLKNLTARLEDLEAELEDFARAAAVEKRSHGHSRAGTDARFAAARSEAYKGMTYKDFLKKRGIELGVYWGIRNLFARNIRRTLYAGDLAREAAYCEAKIRELMPDSDLPDDAKRAVKAIEDGIYHNHLLHLDTAGRFSAERSALYQTERELSAAETVTASVDMKLKIPDKGNFPGIEKAQSLKVTSKYTNVELTPNDFYPEATSGAGWKRLTPAQKNFDPAMKRLEESAGKELLPLRPWESKESLDVSVDVSAVPFAGEILDLSFRKGLNADLAGKSASADLVRELVFRHVNKAIAESAKKSASTFIKGISPSDGVFKADQSHTITFRLVKEYRPNGKYVYKLKETSLDAKGRQSAGIGMPAKPGLKFSAGVARSSSENVRYWVGEDSLSGVMSRYGRLGRKTVMWEAFLNEQRNSIADLAKNAGAPKYIGGEDLTSEEFEPRTGLQGELDRIQQHMWMHGDRAQYDAFMNAWADVHAAAGAINSADENAQKYGKAMTRLLSTISNFYRKENAWWEMKEMPLASGPAAQGKEPPASESVSLGVGMHAVEQGKCIRLASTVLENITPEDLGLEKADATTWKKDYASELTYLKGVQEEEPGRFYDDVLTEIGDGNSMDRKAQETAIKAVMKRHVALIGKIEIGEKLPPIAGGVETKVALFPSFRGMNLAVRVNETRTNSPEKSVTIPKGVFRNKHVPADVEISIDKVFMAPGKIPMVSLSWVDALENSSVRTLMHFPVSALLACGVTEDAIKVDDRTKAEQRVKVKEDKQREEEIPAGLNAGGELKKSIKVDDIQEHYDGHGKSDSKLSNENKMEHTTVKQRSENIEERLKAQGETSSRGEVSGNVKLNQNNNKLTAAAFINKHRKKLTSDLTMLHAQVLKQLGINDKSAIIELIPAKFPALDVDSDKFKEIVQDVLKGNENLSEAYLLNKLFGQIREDYQPRDIIKVKNLESLGAVAMKDMKDKGIKVIDRENKLVQITLGQICDAKKGNEMSVKDYTDALNNLFGENEWGLIDTPIEKTLEIIPYFTLEMLEEPYKGLKDNLENAKTVLSDSVSKLDGFSQKEKDSIRKAIENAVISPFDKADTIWAVKPRSLMLHIVDKMRESTFDAKEFLKGIIGEMIERNFTLHPKQQSNVRILAKDFDPVGAKQEKVSKQVEEIINNKQFLRQSGRNNCFIVSVLNALLSTEAGCAKLKKCFCEGKDGTYQFAHQMTVSDEDVKGWKQRYSAEAKKMSNLECIIWTAMDKRWKDLGKKGVEPGSQGFATDVAELFGLIPKALGGDDHLVELPENELAIWVNAKNHLANNQIAIVHIGGGDGGHYVAAKDVVAAKDDSPGQNKKIICYDSLKAGTGEIKIGIENFVKKSDDVYADNQIFLFEVPRDNGLKS